MTNKFQRTMIKNQNCQPPACNFHGLEFVILLGIGILLSFVICYLGFNLSDFINLVG